MQSLPFGHTNFTQKLFTYIPAAHLDPTPVAWGGEISYLITRTETRTSASEVTVLLTTVLRKLQ